MQLSAPLIAVLVCYRAVAVLFLQRCVDVPDEWWQSTEVAYQNVFHVGHLSWEWESGLRSYFGYPLLFDGIFRCLQWLGADSALLIWLLPRLVCVGVTVAIDVQTYRLGALLDQKWGPMKNKGSVTLSRSSIAETALFFSASHWYTSHIALRTQSNVLEALAVLTAVQQRSWMSFLFFAGCGCGLRLSAAVPLIVFAVWHLFQGRWLRALPLRLVQLLMMLSSWIAVLCLIDRWYYQEWTFSLWNFISFNVLEGHSAMFGAHPWHWYISAALPALLAPYIVLLPLTLCLLCSRSRPSSPTPTLYRLLVASVCVATAVYSAIPHKELRFFYPLIPLLIVLCAAAFHHSPFLHDRQVLRKKRTLLLVLFTILNVGAYGIVSLTYRRGMLDVMSLLREGEMISQGGEEKSMSGGPPLPLLPRVHVLAGCYSTPGYSFVHRSVKELRLVDCGVQHRRDPKTGQIQWWRGVTQHHVLGQFPKEFVQYVYDGQLVTDNATVAKLLRDLEPPVEPGSWPLPDVIVAYRYVARAIEESFLRPHGYRPHPRSPLYHTFLAIEDFEDTTVEVWWLG